MSQQDEDFDSEDSLLFEQQQKVTYISVKKHLSEPKSLLEGAAFEPYHFHTLFDFKIDALAAVKGTSVDKCHINKLEEAMFDHFRLKKQVNEAMYGTEDNGLLLEGSLYQKYKGKLPIYQKFPSKDTKYFATEMISLRPGRKAARGGRNKWPAEGESIRIDSEFQFGNLFRAYKVGENAYELVLQNDVNTKGNNQWFFFRVRGVPKNTVLRFEIVNLVKKESLFNEGMKPAVFSKIRYEKKGIGWVREGQRVSYTSNPIRKQCREGHYYSLCFEYKTLYEHDDIYFSHSYPYTYSDLNNFMTQIFMQTHPNLLMNLSTLGESIAGNRVDMVTITGKGSSKSKKVVWIIARQHPGEVTGSFVAEGVIKSLLGESDIANYLRENCVFKIIPMVNPDGVLHGNSRCELVGTDPNRKWKTPHRTINPVISQIRQAISKSSNTEMVLDLHSHSRKLGTFFYGNLEKTKERSRVYPLIVCQNDPKFSFVSSRFSEGPKSTARYSLHKLLNIPNVFTVESSFYGYESNNKIIEYLPDDYRDIGTSLLEGYAIMLNEMNSKISRLSFDFAMKKLQMEPALVEQGEVLSSGSNSDPSGDELDAKQLERILPKKLDLRKKKKKSRCMQKKSEVKAPEPLVKESSKIQPKQEPPIEKPSTSIRKRKPSLLPIRRVSVECKRVEPVNRQLLIFNASKSVQTDEVPLLRPVNRVIDVSKHLVIVGQKVEDREIWLEGNNTIGIQSAVGQVFTASKSQLKRPTRAYYLMAGVKENRTFVREYSRK